MWIEHWITFAATSTTPQYIFSLIAVKDRKECFLEILSPHRIRCTTYTIHISMSLWPLPETKLKQSNNKDISNMKIKPKGNKRMKH